jgi:hypothetical protein
MSRKFLAFDVETAKQFPGDFSDWRKHRPLGICCAATVAGDTGKLRLWHGVIDDGCPAASMNATELGELVNHLLEMSRQGYEIVTWNGLQFDFDVLAEESELWDRCRELARGHVDMMFQVVCQLGHVLSLDAAAKGMRLRGKIEDVSGQLAPELWARGEYDQVLQYVEQDARCTLELAEACERNGRLRWVSRRGGSRDMPLSKGWLRVDKALKLPLPDTSWMTSPIKRERFTAWLG